MTTWFSPLVATITVYHDLQEVSQTLRPSWTDGWSGCPRFRKPRNMQVIVPSGNVSLPKVCPSGPPWSSCMWMPLRAQARLFSRACKKGIQWNPPQDIDIALKCLSGLSVFCHFFSRGKLLLVETDCNSNHHEISTTFSTPWATWVLSSPLRRCLQKERGWGRLRFVDCRLLTADVSTRSTEMFLWNAVAEGPTVDSDTPGATMQPWGPWYIYIYICL